MAWECEFSKPAAVSETPIRLPARSHPTNSFPNSHNARSNASSNTGSKSSRGLENKEKWKETCHVFV